MAERAGRVSDSGCRGLRIVCVCTSGGHIPRKKIKKLTTKRGVFGQKM